MNNYVMSESAAGQSGREDEDTNALFVIYITLCLAVSHSTYANPKRTQIDTLHLRQMDNT